MLVRSRMYARLLLLLGLSIGRRWDAEGKNVLESLLASLTEKKEFQQGDRRERDASSPTWPVREGGGAEDKSRSSRLHEENVSRTDHRRDSVARRLPYYRSSEDDHDTKPPVKSPHYTWPPSVRAVSYSCSTAHQRNLSKFVTPLISTFRFSFRIMAVCDQSRSSRLTIRGPQVYVRFHTRVPQPISESCRKTTPLSYLLYISASTSWRCETNSESPRDDVDPYEPADEEDAPAIDGSNRHAKAHRESYSNPSTFKETHNVCSSYAEASNDCSADAEAHANTGPNSTANENAGSNWSADSDAGSDAAANADDSSHPKASADYGTFRTTNAAACYVPSNRRTNVHSNVTPVSTARPYVGPVGASQRSSHRGAGHYACRNIGTHLRGSHAATRNSPADASPRLQSAHFGARTRAAVVRHRVDSFQSPSSPEPGNPTV
jgi:hypothetical protein